jgi:3-phenylpropionate/trans-cinnamate dioxygenase ferredoxin reductase subunit
MSSLESVVIVGASLAGMHAAHTLRREGFDGRVTMVDADPNTPYDKPPLSKQVLQGEWDVERITLSAAKEDLGLDWRLGHRATSLDLGARVVAISAGDGSPEESVTYDGLLLATGASARRLPNTPDLAGIHVLRTLDDCLALRADLEAKPERVVVIGAGFIGAEVASSCRKRGLEVTLIEALEVPLERALGRAMGLVTAEIHRDHGVDLRLGVGVAGFDGTPGARVQGVRLTDGSVVPADVVVVGVGVAPNTGWLESSGLTIDNGIVVDATLLAAPGVVAAGDIARWPSARFGELMRIEHWENAIQMGEAAARRLLVADGEVADVYDPVPWFWSDQYDRKIQLAGRSGPDDLVEVVHGSVEERRFVALYGRGGKVVGVLGINRPRHVMQLRQLVIDGADWESGLATARALT